MATKVGDVFAELRLRADKAEADLKDFRTQLKGASGDMDKGEKRTKTFGQSLKKLGGQAKHAGGLVAKGMAIGSAAITGAALVAFSFVKSWAEATDTMGKLSSQINITAGELQGLKFAAELSGESGESVTNAIKQFARLSIDAREKGVTPFSNALFQLGLSFKDLDDKTFTEKFGLIADRLNNVDDSALKTSLTLRLLGRDGQKLGNTLALTSKGINAAVEEFHNLGGTLSKEALAAAADFNDEMLRLTSTVTGIKNLIGTRLTPVITRMVTRWRLWILANRQLLATKIDKFLRAAADAAVRLVPQIVALAESVIGLVDGLGGIEQALELAIGGLVLFRIAFIAALGPAGPIAAAIGGIILLFDTLATRVDNARRKSEEMHRSALRAKTLLDDPDFDPSSLTSDAQRRRISNLDREQKILKETLATRKQLRGELKKTGTVSGRFGETRKVVPKIVLSEFDRVTENIRRDIVQVTEKISTIVAADRARAIRTEGKRRKESLKEQERREPLIKEFQKLSPLFIRGKLKGAQLKKFLALAKDLKIDLPTKTVDPFADKKGPGAADRPKTPAELIQEALGGGGKLNVGGLVPSGPGTTINHNNFTINLAPADIDIVVKDLPQNASAMDVASKLKDVLRGAVADVVRQTYDTQVRQVVG